MINNVLMFLNKKDHVFLYLKEYLRRFNLVSFFLSHTANLFYINDIEIKSILNYTLSLEERPCCLHYREQYFDFLTHTA